MTDLNKDRKDQLDRQKQSTRIQPGQQPGQQKQPGTTQKPHQPGQPGQGTGTGRDKL